MQYIHKLLTKINIYLKMLIEFKFDEPRNVQFMNNYKGIKITNRHIKNFCKEFMVDPLNLELQFFIFKYTLKIE